MATEHYSTTETLAHVITYSVKQVMKSVHLAWKLCDYTLITHVAVMISAVPRQNRTNDLRISVLLLYQLSYLVFICRF